MEKRVLTKVFVFEHYSKHPLQWKHYNAVQVVANIHKLVMQLVLPKYIAKPSSFQKLHDIILGLYVVTYGVVVFGTPSFRHFVMCWCLGLREDGSTAAVGHYILGYTEILKYWSSNFVDLRNAGFQTPKNHLCSYVVFSWPDWCKRVAVNFCVAGPSSGGSVARKSTTRSLHNETQDSFIFFKQTEFPTSWMRRGVDIAARLRKQMHTRSWSRRSWPLPEKALLFFVLLFAKLDLRIAHLQKIFPTISWYACVATRNAWQAWNFMTWSSHLPCGILCASTMAFLVSFFFITCFSKSGSTIT